MDSSPGRRHYARALMQVVAPIVLGVLGNFATDAVKPALPAIRSPALRIATKKLSQN